MVNPKINHHQSGFIGCPMVYPFLFGLRIWDAPFSQLTLFLGPEDAWLVPSFKTLGQLPQFWAKNPS